MTEIFRGLLSLALNGSIGVLVVLVFRFLLKPMPKRVWNILWLIVAFRFLCPFTLEGPIPAFWESTEENFLTPGISATTENRRESLYLPQINVSENANQTDSISENDVVQYVTDTQEKIDPSYEDTMEQAPTLEVNKQAMTNWLKQNVWFTIWGIGTVLLAVYSVWKYLFTWIKIRQSIQITVYDKVNVYENIMPGLPASFGLIHPGIYVPVGFLENTVENDYILCHERIHVKHLDPQKKVLMYVLLCVYWWNPLVWLMIRLMTTDMEMACDESVLKVYGEKDKVAYASTVMNYALKQSGLELPAFFGKSNTEKRIQNVLNYKKYALIPTCLFIALALLLGIIIATKPHAVKDTKVEPVEEQENPIPTQNEQGEIVYHSFEEINQIYSAKIENKLLAEGIIDGKSPLMGEVIQSCVYGGVYFWKEPVDAESLELWRGDYVVFDKYGTLRTYRYELELEHIEEEYTLKQENIKELINAVRSKSLALEQDTLCYSYGEERLIENIADYLLKTNAAEYDLLFSPDSAAEYLLHLDGGTCEYTLRNIREAMVTYTFEDGNQVHYIMVKDTNHSPWFPQTMIDNYEWAESYIENIEYIQKMRDALAPEILLKETHTALGMYPEEETDTGYILLNSINGQNVSLYGTFSHERGRTEDTVLLVGNRAYPLYVPWNMAYGFIPKVYPGDFDKDGKTEYAILMQGGTGTGVSTNLLYMVEIEDDQATTFEFTYADYSKEIEEHVQYKYMEENNSIQLFDGDGTFIKYYDLVEDSFEKLVFGDIMYISCLDDYLFWDMSGGVITKEVAYPQYETDITMRCPLHYFGDGEFHFGKWTVDMSIDTCEEIELQPKKETEETLFQVVADVTRDNVPDIIKATIQPEEGEDYTSVESYLMSMAHLLKLEIHSGAIRLSSSKYPENEPFEDSIDLIYAKDLGQVHPANGIFYLVHDGDKEYLMEIGKSIYQGCGEFYYQVFALNDGNGTKYVIDEAWLPVDLNDPFREQPIGDMVEFTQKLQAWIDKGELLVLADVDLGIRLRGESMSAWEIWDPFMDELPKLRKYRE